MKRHFVCLLVLLQTCLLSAIAQEPEQKSQGPSPPKLDQQLSQGSVAKTRQPSPEMQKIFNAFLGTWSVTEEIEPSETMPKGGVGWGEEVYRAGPGGASMTEEVHLKEPDGEISGFGVGWWDHNAQGFRAVWCDSKNPGGCILMAHLAKWEGDQFVLAMSRKEWKEVHL